MVFRETHPSKKFSYGFGWRFLKKTSLGIGLLDFHMEFWVNLSSSFLAVSIMMKVNRRHMKKPVLDHVWPGKKTTSYL